MNFDKKYIITVSGFCLAFCLITFGVFKFSHKNDNDIGNTISSTDLLKNLNNTDIKSAPVKSDAPIINLANCKQYYSLQGNKLVKHNLSKNLTYVTAKQKLQSIALSKLPDAYYLDLHQNNHIYFERNSELTFNNDSRVRGSDFYNTSKKLGYWNPKNYRLDDIGFSDPDHWEDVFPDDNPINDYDDPKNNKDPDVLKSRKYFDIQADIAANTYYLASECVSHNYGNFLLDIKQTSSDSGDAYNWNHFSGNQNVDRESLNKQYPLFSYQKIMTNTKLRQAHLNNYDYRSLQKREWHPVSYVEKKHSDKMHPVVYYLTKRKAYYIPLTKIKGNYYYQTASNKYIAVSDVCGINNHQLFVYNAPVIVKSTINKSSDNYSYINKRDPYNYGLHYGYPLIGSKGINNKYFDDYPNSRIIDEPKYSRHLLAPINSEQLVSQAVLQNALLYQQFLNKSMPAKTDPYYKDRTIEEMLRATKLSNYKVPEPSKRYMKIDHDRLFQIKETYQKLNLLRLQIPLSYQKSVIAPNANLKFSNILTDSRLGSFSGTSTAEKYANLFVNYQPANTLHQMPTVAQLLSNKPDIPASETQHLLAESFGYTHLDPKPTNPFSRFGTDPNDPDRCLPNNWLIDWLHWQGVKTPVTKHQKSLLINSHSNIAHGLYLKFGIGGENGQPAQIRYPANKVLYLQSIVRNSIQGRNNEFYLITRYNEPTKNGVRQWTYPVMDTKDVHISDIVKHKQIPTHYNNFLDTAIFTYHMLDFDRYNGFSNTYRFVYDPHSILGSNLFVGLSGAVDNNIFTSIQPESRTTDETIFDTLLPPIDTAEDNLKQEEHR